VVDEQHSLMPSGLIGNQLKSAVLKNGR
jgi:hypothetical protein